MKRAPIAALVALSALGLLWARRPKPVVRDSLLLVTLDTTRADRLGAYGYAKARTPAFDRLAREGVRFDAAFSPVPLTLPAHASLLTGALPPTHGVRNNGFHLADTFPTLASHLQARGFATGAAISAFVLDGRYGLRRGFDVYDDALPGTRQLMPWGGGSGERRGETTAAALSAWLQQRTTDPKPFFAWLHLYDAHHPYAAPAPYDTGDAYDGEVAYADHVLDGVLQQLTASGLADRTVVVVAGDHGEALGEHGEETHGIFVYDGTIRVPLVLWAPGRVAPRVVAEPVRLVDVAPTVLELLGQPPLPSTDGRSLAPALAGRPTATPPAVYAESLLPELYMGWAPVYALRDARFKLIDTPKAELYDVARDAAEATNLHGTRNDVEDALRRELGRIRAEDHGPRTAAPIDREAAEKLAALGYVGAVAPAAVETRSGADPKDMIAVYNELARAHADVRARRFAEALPVFDSVLARDPGNTFAMLGRGTTFMGMERWADALAALQAYAAKLPGNAFVHQWMATCHMRLGHPDDALRESEAALAVDPRLTDARALRSAVLFGRGDMAGAIRELEAAIAADPTKPLMHLNLGRVLLRGGRVAEAEAQLREALALAPDMVPAMIELAGVRMRNGDKAGAEALLRDALAREPGDVTARLNLGSILEAAGRRDEAATEYRRVAEDASAPAGARAAARQRLTRVAP